MVLKTGRSGKAQELAASHTGSLSGADKVLRAVFRRYGVIEARDLEELCGLAAAFSWLESLPKGQRCVFMNVSGGKPGSWPIWQMNSNTTGRLRSRDKGVSADFGSGLRFR
ncbi:MAG: hypothetical protein ACLRMZ_10770 [Blautia marasmi]